LPRINLWRRTLTTVRIYAVRGTVIVTIGLGWVDQSHSAPDDPHAVDAPPIDFYVGDQEEYDSNLYRQPSYVTNFATAVAPNATKADYLNTIFTGFDGRWTPGQQEVDLNLRANDNRFAHNDMLNNYSGSADLLWDWRIGSYFSGQLGGDFTRTLANFSETLFLGRDVVNSTDYYGNARYQVGPRWAVYGGVREVDALHSAVPAQYNDYRSSSGNVGVEYATSVENTIGFEYQYQNGRFDHGEFLLNDEPFDRDFGQNSLGLLAKYIWTEKTAFNASVNYLRRSYTNEPVGAFSGVNWNVSMQWQATDKTQVLFSVYRLLQAYLASQSDYYTATGGSIAPSWSPTEKLTFKLIVASAKQNYIDTSPSVLLTGAREDRVNSQQATFIYIPIRALTLNFAYTHQQRSSNQAVYGFDDNLATVAATFKF
jgi:hypothetical protein